MNTNTSIYPTMHLPATRPQTGFDLRSLQILIADSPNPTFVIDAQDHKILCANEAAFSGCGTEAVTGWELSTFIESVSDPKFGELVYFNNQWLRIQHTPFEYAGEQLVKVVLLQDDQLPTSDMLNAVSDLNAVLLHRFRSPITGIQGFVSLLKDPANIGRSSVYLEKVDLGLTQLVEMLEELDLLQALEREDEVLYASEPVAIGRSAEQVANSKVSETGKPVIVQRPRQEPLVYTNEAKLQHALKILLDNAVDFNRGEKPVRVEVEKNRIRVINYGRAIPEEIADKVFHPFITTRANSLGIGLTLAHIVLRHVGASVFLKQNDAENGVIFEIMLPPQ
ncbi:MAG: two component signal transduction system histidine kinase [Bacteroidetes bacterium HLUCCA01]|nr:MAG: two component signal transduction system histidine kinase [Bacteroidetes bacterium HLUCCA01]